MSGKNAQQASGDVRGARWVFERPTIDGEEQIWAVLARCGAALVFERRMEPWELTEGYEFEFDGRTYRMVEDDTADDYGCRAVRILPPMEETPVTDWVLAHQDVPWVRKMLEGWSNSWMPIENEEPDDG